MTFNAVSVLLFFSVYHLFCIIFTVQQFSFMNAFSQVASKFFDDQFYNNAYFAKIGGVLRQEINILEIDFLCLLRFEAGTHIEEAYIQYYEEICRHSLLCPCRQGKR